MGWLLRTYRGPRTLGELARAFAKRSPAWAVSPATISRWETGAVAVSYQVVRRYERLFGLASHELVAVLDTMHRYWSPSLTSAPTLSRRPQPFDDLLDQACSPVSLSAKDWDELTLGLAMAPNVHLPRRVWTELTERLLVDLTVANGIDWHRLYESYCRLLAHPRGRLAAVDSCVTAARDRGHQTHIEIVSILDANGDPAASAAVVEQLEDPTTDAAQQGALLACVRKLRLGHFSPAQRHRIADVVRSLPQRGDTGRIVDAILTSTEASGRAPVAVEARPSRTDPQTRARAVGRVAAGANDPALELLVGEMLFALGPGTRLSAASLIAASPYRTGVARALTAELTRSRVVLDRSGWPDVVLAALRLVGGAAERGILERLAATPGVATEVARTAAYSLGHLPGTTDRQYWEQVLRLDTSPDVLEGLVYSAGLTKLRPVLEAIQNAPDLPARPRRAAAWWLNRAA
ncbi:helix-turn-helix domain-containing protein [Tenggerimyces flavus]|uniref:Helix-turn-helix domain-containing protein n=1 Tax=Tenggerimyces flavus TaxID=1708749 RepID=A0ABV7YKM6_9ACTN|nr:helix-turn-helix domain-containing protein [Tenggerimyces flavus]